MKQKDIALVAVVAIFSLIIALVVSNVLFSSTGSRNLTAEKVDPISSTFVQPDKKYFNDQSVDPTQLIRIDEYKNPTPFN